MAEAHQAVAFSFSITHEGWDINYDREVLNLVWDSGIRSWKKRIGRLRVSFRCAGTILNDSSQFLNEQFIEQSHFLANYRIAFEMERIQHICRVYGSSYR